ncbi:DUF4178 domain-containing protein [Asticcacaulis sp. 201]|uniref:DUF4178 domain-containing protein n=1 Tax=Asticcacaulis sp. 201 TaxID=3028787 RepID=UPI0029165731|nr:DUF4178 domain-containing protein [Asticcacaulis sp. 201]MDV6333250.1 DUF4178 domain-containing protein [Asticcacaulis sp. 201]
MTDRTFGQRPAVQSVGAFQCPTCGGPIALRAVGISVTAVCRQCSTVIDTANPNLRVIQAANKKAFDTDIAIGTRGELFGTMWEVIGYVRKWVKGTVYAWDEYLLFNPWEGFRFLSQSNGHWTFFKRLNRAIEGIGRNTKLTYDDQTYTVFNKDRVFVDAVQGEFYWRVKTGDESDATDYICPPYMLSSESTDDEINITHGVYVEPNLIKKAFPYARLVTPSGVGACQPSPHGSQGDTIVRLGAIAAGVAIVLHLAISGGLPNKSVIEVTGHPIQVMPLPTSTPSASTQPAGGAMWSLPGETQTAPTAQTPQTDGQPVVTESFTLPRMTNIRLDTATQIDNGWADFDLTLINETTQATYPMHESVSYYHGLDDGESWHEGHNAARTWLSSVPAGRYHLVIDAETDQFSKDGQLPFSLTLRRGLTEWSNLWIALLLILIYPGIVLFRQWSFESQRWSNSDFKPDGSRAASIDSSETESDE